MTTSQRAQLRSLAMQLQPTTNIGKNGITDTLIKQIDEQLSAHELVKISVLKNADFGAKEVIQQLADACGAQAVQAIGNKITLYRYSEKDGVQHVI